MAIDKNIFNTLDTGAKNQILSAAKQYWETSQQVRDLYSSFTTPSPITTQPISWWQPTQPPVVETKPVVRPDMNAPIKDNNITTQTSQFVTPDLWVILPWTTTSKPTEVKPTPQQTQTTTWVDVNRTNEIIKNLNTWYSQDEQVKKAIDNWDWETFKSRYNMQNPEEARIVEEYFKKQQANQFSKNPDNIYNTLKFWWTIVDQSILNTPEYQQAKIKASLYNKYSNASADSLYSAFINWEIPSDIQKDLMTNPNYAIAKQKYDKKISTDNTNNQMSSAYNVITWKTTEIKDKSEELSDKMYAFLTWMGKTDTDMVSFKDYMATNYPDIVSQSTELNAKNKELRTLQETADNNLKKIQSTHPWISKGTAMLLAQKENEAIYEQMKTLQFDMSELSANIQFQTNQANQEYSWIEKQQARKEQLEAEQRGYAFDMLKTQQSQEFQREMTQEERAYNEQQANRQFDLKYGDIQSEDPRVQKVAFERMAEQIQTQYAWMPFRRDISTMASDFQTEYNNLVASWVSPTEAINKITTDVTNAIQNAPAYTEWATKKGLIKDQYTTQMQNIELATAQEQLAQLKNKTIETSNPKWEQDKEWNWYDSNSNVRPDIQKTNAVLSSPMANTPNNTVFKESERGYWCGQFVNDSLWTRLFWDSLESKTSKINSTVPVQWWVVVMDMPWKFAKNWHVWLVVWFTNDWILMKSSNFSAPWKVTTEEIKFNDPRIKGYYTPTTKTTTQTTQWTWTTTWLEKVFTDTQKNLMSKIDIKNPTKTDESILAKSWLNLEDVYNYQASLKAGKWSEWLDDTEYKRVNSIIDDLSTNQVTKTFQKSQEAYLWAINFAKWDTATDNQALIYSFAKAMDPDSVVREWEYATVQKYAQTWGEKLWMDINRVLNWQEFIWPEAKNNIVQSIKSKYEASKSSYENLRKNKITMVNDIAWKDIWNKAIPTDVMNIWSIKMYPDWTYIEYDNKGNYRYYWKDKKLSSWQPVWQSTPTKWRIK